MPSRNAQLLLRHLILNGIIQDLHQLTNSQWMEIIGDGSILYETCGVSNLYEDHVQRAKELVNSLVMTGSNVLALMDGHGRIIWQVLIELKTRGLNINAYRFQIYDIDDDVNAWHYRFLPASCEIIPEDILIQSNYPQVVYFNFCGLSHIFPSDYFLNHIQFIKRIKDIVTGSDADLYLSGSIRGVTGRKPLYKLWRYIGNLADNTKILDGVDVNLLSHRGNFFTYEFIPSNFEIDIEQNSDVNIDDVTIRKKQRIV